VVKKKAHMDLRDGGGILIPGNLPDIISAGKTGIKVKSG
jgi:predicted cation transporter